MHNRQEVAYSNLELHIQVWSPGWLYMFGSCQRIWGGVIKVKEIDISWRE